MFEYPINKYKYYICESQRKIIAVSTYEEKIVRGIAKADPCDQFNVDMGKQLAAARCNQKIAMKRQRRAQKELNKSIAAYDQAQKHLYKMNDYYEDARTATKNANSRVDSLLKKM